MPSRDRDREPGRRDRSEREPSSGRGGGPPRGNVDREALALREAGQSYAAVARSLGLKRSGDAHAAVLRALRAAPGEERADLVRRESDRLDVLETRIRSRDSADPEKMQRRLVALGRLRETLP